MIKLSNPFLKNKRAITPVLSNLLLTVVAVAVMAIATTATYVITTNLKETMSERVIMEDLWFNNSTHHIDIYLRNTGKVTVQVSAVYINYTPQFFPKSFNLEIGEHALLNIPYSWLSDRLYHIEIITSRGTHLSEYYTSP